MTHARPSTRIDITNADLQYEKAGLLAEIEHDQVARHLSAVDRRQARARVVTINSLLAVRYR